MTMDDNNPLEALRARDETLATGIDAGRRERIESALRVQHAGQQGSSAVRRRPRALVAAPAMVILLIVATTLLVVRDPSDAAALTVTNANDVTVIQPDGSVVSDPADGFQLEDGAIVEVGTGGSITIDEVTLDGGAVVRVTDGRLVTDVVATTTTAGERDAPPSTMVPADPTTTPSDSTSTRPPQTSTTRPVEPEPTDSPRSTPPEPTDTRPSPIDPSTTVPSDTVSTTSMPSDQIDPENPEPLSIALRVRAGDGRVVVSWKVDGDLESSWSVVLLRTTDGTEPSNSDRAVAVAGGSQGELVQQRDALPDAVRHLRYQVVVHDEAGGVVATGATQSIEPPES